MADVIWKGGAAIVTGVSETILTGANWSGDGNLTATLTGEDGSTQTSVLATTAVTLQAQRDLFLTKLQGEVQTLFAAITWSSLSTTTILGTVKVPGVPITTVGSTVVDTDTNGGITHNVNGTGNSVLSEGPEDFDVDGSGNYASSNWIGVDDAVSIKPSTGDNARFNQGSWSVRYGLQTGVNCNTIRLTEKWTGDYGDPVAGYFLDMDATDGGDKAMYISKRTGRVWATIDCDNVFIRSTAAGAQAVRFGGASVIKDDGVAGDGGIHCTGPGVRGTVQVNAGADLSNFHVGAGTSGTYIINAPLDLFRCIIGSGNCDMNMAAKGIHDDGNVLSAGELEHSGRIQVYGSGTVRHFGTNATANVPLIEVLGGRVEYNGPGTLTRLKMKGGTFSLENSRVDAVTVIDTVQHGGHVEEGGQVNVSWTRFYAPGGTQNISATINQYSTTNET